MKLGTRRYSVNHGDDRSVVSENYFYCQLSCHRLDRQNAFITILRVQGQLPRFYWMPTTK